MHSGRASSRHVPGNEAEAASHVMAWPWKSYGLTSAVRPQPQIQVEGTRTLPDSCCRSQFAEPQHPHSGVAGSVGVHQAETSGKASLAERTCCVGAQGCSVEALGQGLSSRGPLFPCVGLCIKGGLPEEAALPGGVAVEDRARGGGTEALRPALSSDRLQGPRLWRLLTS